LKILAQRARRRRNLAVVLVLTTLVVSILGNALTFFYFEGPARPDLTAWDSIWYSVISITTIGYGDFSATTLGGRIGTIVFITVFGPSTATVKRSSRAYTFPYTARALRHDSY